MSGAGRGFLGGSVLGAGRGVPGRGVSPALCSPAPWRVEGAEHEVSPPAQPGSLPPARLLEHRGPRRASWLVPGRQRPTGDPGLCPERNRTLISWVTSRCSATGHASRAHGVSLELSPCWVLSSCPRVPPGNDSESEEELSAVTAGSPALTRTHWVPASKFHPGHPKLEAIRRGSAKDSQRHRVYFEAQSTATQNSSSESKPEPEYVSACSSRRGGQGAQGHQVASRPRGKCQPSCPT